MDRGARNGAARGRARYRSRHVKVAFFAPHGRGWKLPLVKNSQSAHHVAWPPMHLDWSRGDVRNMPRPDAVVTFFVKEVGEGGT